MTLIQHADKAPASVVKVFPREDNTESFMVESHQIQALKDQIMTKNGVTILQSPIISHEAASLFGVQSIAEPPRGFGQDQGFTTFNIFLILFLVAVLGVIVMWLCVYHLKELKLKRTVTKRTWKNRISIDDEIDQSEGVQFDKLIINST